MVLLKVSEKDPTNLTTLMETIESGYAKAQTKKSLNE